MGRPKDRHRKTQVTATMPHAAVERLDALLSACPGSKRHRMIQLSIMAGLEALEASPEAVQRAWGAFLSAEAASEVKS